MLCVMEGTPMEQKGKSSPLHPLSFGAKSQKRLLVATDLVKFYTAIGRDLTHQKIRWDPVMKDFEIQWKALKAKKDADDPDTPTICVWSSMRKPFD